MILIGRQRDLLKKILLLIVETGYEYTAIRDSMRKGEKNSSELMLVKNTLRIHIYEKEIDGVRNIQCESNRSNVVATTTKFQIKAIHEYLMELEKVIQFDSIILFLTKVLREVNYRRSHEKGLYRIDTRKFHYVLKRKED